MATTKRWNVEIFIDEQQEEGLTHAEARLHADDDTHLHGHGHAKRNPSDRSVPQIGDELAVARALSDLAHRLLQTAAEDIEQFTHAVAHPNL